MSKNEAIRNPQERGDKDRWNNRSRAGKKSFQAMLPPEEAEIVDAVKKATGAATDRELLILLCKERLDKVG